MYERFFLQKIVYNSSIVQKVANLSLSFSPSSFFNQYRKRRPVVSIDLLFDNLSINIYNVR